MKVVLHDRTDIVGPDLREYAQRKLTRLAHHFGKVAEADVEFSPEAKRSEVLVVLCRINVHVDGRRTPLLSAHESGADPQAAFDLAFDKIDRQVVKLKEKRTTRKKAVSPVRVPPDDDGKEKETEPERVRLKLRPVSHQDAIAELESDGQSFHVYLDEDSGKVEIAFKRSDGSVGIIEPIVP
ncbi:MAG: ribosome-associated translation inhibitor RaiA [Candidatus Dormiibacterota bacterium]